MYWILMKWRKIRNDQWPSMPIFFAGIPTYILRNWRLYFLFLIYSNPYFRSKNTLKEKMSRSFSFTVGFFQSLFKQRDCSVFGKFTNKDTFLRYNLLIYGLIFWSGEQAQQELIIYGAQRSALPHTSFPPTVRWHAVLITRLSRLFSKV